MRYGKGYRRVAATGAAVGAPFEAVDELTPEDLEKNGVTAEGLPMERCTVALEFNYTDPRSKTVLGTVWLFAGDGRETLDSDRPMAEITGWSLLLGPVPYQQAAEVHAALVGFLRSAGVEVLEASLAD